MAWGDVPMQAAINTPASAMQFAKDMVYPIMHPIKTADSMLDLAAGGISRGIEAVAGDQSWLPENKATATADAVGNFYKTRYGSEEGFKQAIAKDPIGVLADFSTVMTGGGGLAARTPGMAGKAGRIAKTVGNVANPLTTVEKGAKLVGKTGQAALGALTQTGMDTVGEAYRAGRTGGKANKAFKDNLRGKEPQEAVIADARQALQNISTQRGKQYRQDMANIGMSNAVIDMSPVRQAVTDLIDESFIKGHQRTSDEAISKLTEIADIVDEWSADPSLHNAIGVDALKQRVDELMPSAIEKGKAGRIVEVVRTAVKKAIVDQVPEYADAMKSYENSITAQKELEGALSLRQGNMPDTTLRKLQSVTRNNVNSNYNSRVAQVRELEKAGAGEIMPRLAGQAMNSWLPRGLGQAAMAGGIAATGAFLNPAVLAALPFASPRLVGEGASLLGTAARYGNKVPRPTKNQLLLMRGLGSASQPAQGLLGR